LKNITLNVTPRADGRVCKKIDGRYFTWPNEVSARAALIELARRRELGSADAPTPATPSDPPLRVIANRFRADRQQHVQPGTWSDYETAIDEFLEITGKHRVSSSLRPDDFAKVRRRWAASLGPWKIDNRVQSVRTMFRWAADVARLIDRVPWYGDSFHKSTAADKRRVEREHVAAHGERVFSRGELKQILNHATGPLRAFILLGLNGGMYAAEIAALRHADLRRDGPRWIIDTDRPKTLIMRKFVLWPETVKAIEVCRRGEELLFLTSHGNPWVNGETNSITLLFGRLLQELRIKRRGMNFGKLRHTHISAVGDHPDLRAARLVRGQKFSGIETHYDKPDLKRLRAITDLARRRLLTRSSHR
jgi:hypothetical protein